MRNSLFFAFSVAAIVSGCSSDPETTMDMGGTDVEPVKPALSTTQIDRMGRATINVAVTNPFSLDLSAVGGGQNRAATQDKHSKDGNPATWVATWTPILSKTLAIYDGVDTKCGNQFGACAKGTGCVAADPVNAMRYDVLASTLADDQLYMDSSKTDCSFYLGVEASALGLASLAGTYCGGRTPLHDTVDYMYTAATTGTSGFPTAAVPTFAIHDNVTKDNEVTDSLTVFPFLSDPNP
jgi:hypothetical protein